MTTITIEKTNLVKAIAANCVSFGDSFKGLYVDVDGNIDCCEKSNSGDAVAILTFSGMGEYLDDNHNYPQDDDFDSKGVAEFIVDDMGCLERNGLMMNDNGSETKCHFEIV
jgi:hypothetical protein